MNDDQQSSYNLTIVFHGEYLRSYEVSEFICVSEIVMNNQQSYDYWIKKLQTSTGQVDQNLEKVIEFGKRLLSIAGVREVVLRGSMFSIEIYPGAGWSFVNSLVFNEINSTFQWGVGIVRRKKSNNDPKLEVAL